MSNFSSAGPSSEISKKPHQTKATFRACFESLDNVRDFVGQSAEEFGFGPKAVYAVQLATDEAFTNIVEHAYGGESDELVECTCRFDELALTIILHDCGLAFDPTAVLGPDLKAPLADREIGGLGIYFMRKLMDEVHFSPAPNNRDGCNTLTMIKRKENSV
jgi:anti-sigma regulatory factor (Ser/Thr protein kinase)